MGMSRLSKQRFHYAAKTNHVVTTRAAEPEPEAGHFRWSRSWSCFLKFSWGRSRWLI